MKPVSVASSSSSSSRPPSGPTRIVTLVAAPTIGRCAPERDRRVRIEAEGQGAVARSERGGDRCGGVDARGVAAAALARRLDRDAAPAIGARGVGPGHAARGDRRDDPRRAELGRVADDAVHLVALARALDERDGAGRSHRGRADLADAGDGAALAHLGELGVSLDGAIGIEGDEGGADGEAVDAGDVRRGLGGEREEARRREREGDAQGPVRPRPLRRLRAHRDEREAAHAGAVKAMATQPSPAAAPRRLVVAWTSLRGSDV